MILVHDMDLSGKVPGIQWEDDGTDHPFLLVLDGRVLARSRRARDMNDWALFERGADSVKWTGKVWAEDEARKVGGRRC